MDFKVGDRVEHRVFGKGTVVEIESGLSNNSVLVQFDKKYTTLHNGNFCKGTYEDETCWHFHKPNLDELKLLKLLKFTKQELLDAPIGTKITTNTGVILVKDNTHECKSGIKFENSDHVLRPEEINEDLTINNWVLGKKITKVEIPTYLTTYEEKEKEMTLEEIEKQLGYKIKIKGE